MLASRDPNPLQDVQPELPPASTEALTVPDPAPLPAVEASAEAEAGGLAARAGKVLLRRLNWVMPVLIALTGAVLPMLEGPAFTVAMLLVIAFAVAMYLYAIATSHDTEEGLEAARLSREEAPAPAPVPASPYDLLRGRREADPDAPSGNAFLLLMATLPGLAIPSIIIGWLGLEYATLAIFLFVAWTCAVLWEGNGGVVEAPTAFLVLPGPGDADPDLPGLGEREAAVRGFVERVGRLTFWDWGRVLHWERWSVAKRKSRRRPKALERALDAARRAGRDPGAVAALVRARFAPVIGRHDFDDRWPSHIYAAAVGLLARDLIADEDLRVLYAGFEHVIPLRELDELPPAPKPLPAGAVS